MLRAVQQQQRARARAKLPWVVAATAAAAVDEPIDVFVAPTDGEIEAQWTLITRHLSAHQLGGLDRARERLEPIMRTRRLHIYWGTAPTSTIHVGYLRPLGKLADFLRAGCHVTILLADLHATLDAHKSTWEQTGARSKYYSAMVLTLLSRMGAPLQRLSFVQGWRDMQSHPDYMHAFLELTAHVTPAAAKKASAQVVKQERDPKLSGMVYPLLQALDSHFLQADATLGGDDQIKIYALAEDVLPRIGLAAPVHLLNPMLPSLCGKAGVKMSATTAAAAAAAAGAESGVSNNGKLDLLDPPDVLAGKLRKAFCEEGNIECNGVLALSRLLFELDIARQLVDSDSQQVYTNADDIERAFADKRLHPVVLKQFVTRTLDVFLEPLRNAFASPDGREMIALAYAQ